MYIHITHTHTLLSFPLYRSQNSSLLEEIERETGLVSPWSSWDELLETGLESPLSLHRKKETFALSLLL